MIYQALRKKFPEKEFALMAEVRDKAGFEASRSADYIAVNLWPSRGLAIHGIELKSHRSDWLNELKNPKKAENIFQYCDYFYLLTENDKVAKLEEIPTSWGWMMLTPKGIVTMKEAPKLQPIALSRHFVCAMLKRAVDKSQYVHRDEIKNEIEVAKESVKLHNGYEVEQARRDRATFKKILDDFKASSGIDLENSRWQGVDKIGEAVKFITNGGVESIKEQLQGLDKTATIVKERISKALENL